MRGLPEQTGGGKVVQINDGETGYTSLKKVLNGSKQCFIPIKIHDFNSYLSSVLCNYNIIYLFIQMVVSNKNMHLIAKQHHINEELLFLLLYVSYSAISIIRNMNKLFSPIMKIDAFNYLFTHNLLKNFLQGETL